MEGVASEGVLGESRPNGILANAAAVVCITSDLPIMRPESGPGLAAEVVSEIA